MSEKARKLVTVRKEIMLQGDSVFTHLLVPLDGSALAECVLPHVVALGRTFNSRVTLLRVLESSLFGRPNMDLLGWQLLKREAELYLVNKVAQLEKVGLRAEHVLLEGNPAARIIDSAHKLGADLIILSSHGAGGLSAWNVSSISQKVLLRGQVSMFLVRAYATEQPDWTSLRYTRVLVPLDGSQRADYTLPIASSLASCHSAQLLLAHVVQIPEMNRHRPLLQEEIELADQLTERNRSEASVYLRRLCTHFYEDAETRLLVDEDVALRLHQLVEEENVDLVVMTAHGHSGRKFWPYGSIATAFIMHGTTPLLIVQDFPRQEAALTKAEMAALEYAGHAGTRIPDKGRRRFEVSRSTTI